ncbi:hypothetical protein NDU88_003147 [Pleurodeles waltl]|uniref:Uncharacterized protein n=1 Tax=Pleurodeles waltl TaxID=8319 RepID=A0AAV7QAY6_PLEWA|nr:hypothetical protein NDU88_003147 [Pleurodeles waltl]
MAHSYSYEEDEYFGGDSSSFEEILVGALDNSVQLYVNKALAKALGPLTHHFESFTHHKGWLPHITPSGEAQASQPSTSKGKSKAKKQTHSEIFDKLSASIQKEHGYSSSQQHKAHETDQSSDHSSSKHSSDSDSEADLGNRPSTNKWKKSDKSKSPVPKDPRVLTFNPEDIVQPRSSSWTPPQEVASYIQEHIRAGFDKDVMARLRAGCPRPDLDGRVTDTPDIDPTMVTYMKKWGKDPKKGLNRAWRSC